jgi:hypothetical protein
MARPKKSLEDLCVDGTFLARRHAHLLEDEALVEEPSLCALQEAYRDEASELERRALAVRFEKAVRVAVATTLAQQRDDLLDELDELLHAEPVEVDMDASIAASRRHMEALRCRDLRATGLSYRAIGERVGRSPAAARRLVLSVTPSS